MSISKISQRKTFWERWVAASGVVLEEVWVEGCGVEEVAGAQAAVGSVRAGLEAEEGVEH